MVRILYSNLHRISVHPIYLPLAKLGFLLDTISCMRDHRQQSTGCPALVTYIGISWRRTRLLPPHVLFLHSIPSLCLLAPSFIPTFFLRSSITLYLSSLLSFTRASSPSFCRSHAVITGSVASPIHHLDLLSSVLPPLPSFPPSFFGQPPCNWPP